MARALSIEEAEAIVKSGKFEDFVGVVEDDRLEFKGSPYQLASESDKAELAKDVSALANVAGGLIVIGPQTVRDVNHLGDEVRSVSCFPQRLVDIDKYHKVLRDWIYPSVRGLEIAWYSSRTDAARGMVVLKIPPEAVLDKPMLVVKSCLDSSGKAEGALFGFFERTRVGAQPMSLRDVRERFREGFRAGPELGDRLARIEHLLDKMVIGRNEHQPPIPEPVPEWPDIGGLVTSARITAKLEGQPTFFFAMVPREGVEVPGLFESRSSAVVQLLEKPPVFRDDGFNLTSPGNSEIIKGEWRRVLKGNELSQLGRNGQLAFVCPGDGWHLCWATDTTIETGLKINNIALTETTLLFACFAIGICKLFAPVPERVRLYMGLINISPQGMPPCRLSPVRPGPFGERFEQPRTAPEPTLMVYENVNPSEDSPEQIAYRLLAEVYAWFGFDAVEVPYVDRSKNPPEVAPAMFIKK